MNKTGLQTDVEALMIAPVLNSKKNILLSIHAHGSQNCLCQLPCVMQNLSGWIFGNIVPNSKWLDLIRSDRQCEHPFSRYRLWGRFRKLDIVGAKAINCKPWGSLTCLMLFSKVGDNILEGAFYTNLLWTWSGGLLFSL